MIVLALPKVIQEYIEYANPYKVLHAHGVAMEQAGILRTNANSKWKKITSTIHLSYPLIELSSEIKALLYSEKLKIGTESSEFRIKSFGLTNLSQINRDEVLQMGIHFYLSHLPWMPWAFNSEHVLIEELSDHVVEVSLARYPEVKGNLSFSESGRIISYEASCFRSIQKNFEMLPWKVTYSKYNIKKSYKVPTQASFYTELNGELVEYLNLERITAMSIL